MYSYCTLIGLCTFSLIFKYTFIILSTEWFHSSVPLHLRLYFPCIASQFSNIPGNQFHSELVFLSVNWELFSPIFSHLLHFHSPKENVIARKRKKRMKIGEFLNEGLTKNWESPINRDSDLVAHTTKPSTFFDSISMILPWHGRENQMLILFLWAQNSLSLDLDRRYLLNKGYEREVWNLGRIFSFYYFSFY